MAHTAKKILDQLEQEEELDVEAFLMTIRQAGFHTARGVLNDTEDAEDAVQNAMIQFIRHKDNQFLKRSKLSSWFYRIVVNEALMIGRKKQAHQRRCQAYTDVLQSHIPTSIHIENHIIARSQYKRILKACRKMPKEQKEALKFYGTKPKAKQVNMKTGKKISETGKKSRRLRAVVELKRRLDLQKAPYDD